MIIATNSIAEFHRVQTRIMGFLRKRRVWGAPYKCITIYDREQNAQNNELHTFYILSIILFIARHFDVDIVKWNSYLNRYFSILSSKNEY